MASSVVMLILPPLVSGCLLYFLGPLPSPTPFFPFGFSTHSFLTGSLMWAFKFLMFLLSQNSKITFLGHKDMSIIFKMLSSVCFSGTDFICFSSDFVTAMLSHPFNISGPKVLLFFSLYKLSWSDLILLVSTPNRILLSLKYLLFLSRPLSKCSGPFLQLGYLHKHPIPQFTNWTKYISLIWSFTLLPISLNGTVIPRVIEALNFKIIWKLSLFITL